MLSENEIERYSRQLILTGWGGREQERLKRTTAFIDANYISAAIYLAAAGVGSIVVVGTNPSSIGTDSLAQHICRLNPEIRVTFSQGSLADLPPEDTKGEIVSIWSSADSGAPARLANNGSAIEGLAIEGMTVEVGIDPERRLTLRLGTLRLPCLHLTDPGSSNGENHRAILPIPAGIDENLYAGTSAASFLLSCLLNLR